MKRRSLRERAEEAVKQYANRNGFPLTPYSESALVDLYEAGYRAAKREGKQAASQDKAEEDDLQLADLGYTGTQP